MRRGVSRRFGSGRRVLRRFCFYYPRAVRAAFAAFAFTAVLASACLFAGAALEPAVNSLVLIKAKAAAVDAIECAAARELAGGRGAYDGIVSVVTDGGGDVSAVSTDIVKMNMLKAAVTRSANSALKNMEKTEFYVPLGSAAGIALLSGAGPRVKAEISFAGAVSSDFENEFVSAGVNQTEHRIMLKIKAQLVVAVNGRAVNTDVETSLCAVSTVIVGGVPDIDNE